MRERRCLESVYRRLSGSALLVARRCSFDAIGANSIGAEAPPTRAKALRQKSSSGAGAARSRRKPRGLLWEGLQPRCFPLSHNATPSQAA
ncbi:DUF6053 domain-containing protein [Lysobacter capsici]|uniref:DUF6053 domain-containing protein n=1 Tax=Lysobacter capsici TaxID=435897 RepID=UPI003D2F8E7A